MPIAASLPEPPPLSCNTATTFFPISYGFESTITLSASANCLSWLQLTFGLLISLEYKFALLPIIYTLDIQSSASTTSRDISKLGFPFNIKKLIKNNKRFIFMF